MATAAIPRSGKVSMALDPALLIPVFGAGILVYLAVLPLLMLFVGSFQAEVAPREFVYTLKNYHAAYASEYTYSTFLNSLIFGAGSAGKLDRSADLTEVVRVQRVQPRRRCSRGPLDRVARY